jgi:mannose-6-phosphate isomerase-like protein (cupin superfamily)
VEEQDEMEGRVCVEPLRDVDDDAGDAGGKRKRRLLESRGGDPPRKKRRRRGWCLLVRSGSIHDGTRRGRGYRIDSARAPGHRAKAQERREPAPKANDVTVVPRGTTMSDVKARHFDQIPYYQGPNRIPGIKFHTAGRDLGVTAWGMNVLAIDPDCEGHPEHDHAKDGQEEVYVVLRGSGTLKAEAEETPLTVGTLVRVGPGQQRKLLPGPDGLVVLAIGATPGKAYVPR